MTRQPSTPEAGRRDGRRGDPAGAREANGAGMGRRPEACRRGRAGAALMANAEPDAGACRRGRVAGLRTGSGATQRGRGRGRSACSRGRRRRRGSGGPSRDARARRRSRRGAAQQPRRRGGAMSRPSTAAAGGLVLQERPAVERRPATGREQAREPAQRPGRSGDGDPEWSRRTQASATGRRGGGATGVADSAGGWRSRAAGHGPCG